MISANRVLTLRVAFATLHLPQIVHDVTGSTIDGYRFMLNSWEALGPPDVDVRAIRSVHLTQFRAAILGAGYSHHTWRSRWAYLRAILNTCLHEGIIQFVPQPRRQPAQCKSPKPRPTIEDLRRVYEACDVAVWPKTPIKPPTFWRCLYAIAYLGCLRKGDLLDSRRSSVVADDGLRYVPHKTRRFHKTVFVPWDPAGALQWHLELCRVRGVDLLMVCPPCPSYFVREQRRIASSAGVAPELGQLHAIRRAGLDNWRLADRDAPGLIGGHVIRQPEELGTPSVTLDHYLDHEQIMTSAARLLMVPDWMGGLDVRTSQL